MDISSFDDFLHAARAQSAPQRLLFVFAAALSGTGNQAPTCEDAEVPLQGMVQAIQRGEIAAYIPFDRQGQAVQLG